MKRKAIIFENDRLLIDGLKTQDLEALKAMRCNHRIYRYEPAYLSELQGTI